MQLTIDVFFSLTPKAYMTTTKRKQRKKPGWYFIVTLIVVIGCYGFIKSGKGVLKLWRLSRLMRAEQKALKENLERKETLEKERSRLLNDSTYIEEIARKKYGLIKKGEKVFQISLHDSE